MTNQEKILQINHPQLLKLRKLNQNKLTKLMDIYGSCIYEVLMRVDLIDIEINDNYELFLKHTYELFNDEEFEVLTDSFESTSERDEDGYYDTQVIHS
jgi:hypothetical protein